MEWRWKIRQHLFNINSCKRNCICIYICIHTVYSHAILFIWKWKCIFYIINSNININIWIIELTIFSAPFSWWVLWNAYFCGIYYNIVSVCVLFFICCRQCSDSSMYSRNCVPKASIKCEHVRSSTKVHQFENALRILNVQTHTHTYTFFIPIFLCKHCELMSNIAHRFHFIPPKILAQNADIIYSMNDLLQFYFLFD